MPAINNSNIDAPVIGKLYGEEIEIRCDEGSYGSKKVSCSSSGSWEIPICNSCPDGYQLNENLTDCEFACEDKFVANSNYANLSLNSSGSTTVSVVCNEGFSTSGATVQWSCLPASEGSSEYHWQGGECTSTCSKTVNYLSLNSETSSVDIVHSVNLDFNVGEKLSISCNEFGVDFYHAGEIKNEIICDSVGSFSAGKNLFCSNMGCVFPGVPDSNMPNTIVGAAFI